MTLAVNIAQSGSNNVTFRNRIINGAMVIDQRNAGASVNGNGVYTLDRWYAQASQNNKFTVQQNAGSVTPPAGFANYLGVTSSSAYTVGSGEQFNLLQGIEGYNMADFAWGTASASSVTLSFRVYSSLTGTFGGSLQNSAQNRSYPFTYTISSANTWTTISITIAGDTSGTWLKTNGAGIYMWFGLGVGSSVSGTAGAWAGANYTSATGATSVVGTNNATFYITGVQLEKGSTATSFDYRPYTTELQLCQRYFEVLGCGTTLSGTATGNFQHMLRYVVTKRASPTFSLTGNYSVSCAGNDQTISAIASIKFGNTAGCVLNVTPNNNIGVTNGQAVFYNEASNVIQTSSEL
jgi:hypothetical protein